MICRYCGTQVLAFAKAKCALCGAPDPTGYRSPGYPIPVEPLPRKPLDPKRLRAALERIERESAARHSEDGMRNETGAHRRFRNGRWS